MVSAGALQLERNAAGCLSVPSPRFHFPPRLDPETPRALAPAPQPAPGNPGPLTPGSAGTAPPGTGHAQRAAAQASAAVGPGRREVPLRPRFPAPDPARKVGLEAARGRRDGASAAAGKGGGRKGRRSHILGLGQCSRGLTVGRAADRQVAGTSSYLSPNAGPPLQPCDR